MDETLERERKLEPDAGFVLPDLPGEVLEPRTFTSTYYDTPPRSLARCGITLRCRVEDGVARWQLKLPREGGRAELEALGEPGRPPQEVLDLLLAHRRDGELEAVATLETRRAGVRVVSDGRPFADVTLEAVKVLTPAAVDAFEELEIELVDGDADDLDRLSRLLRRAGAHRTKGTPKLMRVLDLADEPSAPPRKAAPVDHVRFLLGRQLRELETYDPGVRLGGDSEDLHKFRVATRRARALIRAARPLFGDQLAPLEEELRWLGGVLGPARDLDVLVEYLQELDLDDDASGGKALVARLERERAGARAAVVEALVGERYLALLERFATELESPLESDSDVELADIARAEIRRLRKAYRKLGPDPEDERLHRVRIKAKRARYAAELAALAEGKPLRKLARAAAELQDVAGSNQDSVVAEERVRELATARSGVAAGRIVERERARRRDARAQLPTAWKRVRRAARNAL